jgi:hypothetical protein
MKKVNLNDEAVRKQIEEDGKLYERIFGAPYEEIRKDFPDFPPTEVMLEYGTWPGRFYSGMETAKEAQERYRRLNEPDHVDQLRDNYRKWGPSPEASPPPMDFTIAKIVIGILVFAVVGMWALVIISNVVK